MNTDHPTHDEYQLSKRHELVSLCRRMLAGEDSFLEGVRKICSLRFEIDVEEQDPDLMVFVAIDSETDHLPSSRVQALMATEATTRVSRELAEAEEWARSTAADACERLIERFSQE